MLLTKKALNKIIDVHEKIFETEKESVRLYYFLDKGPSDATNKQIHDTSVKLSINNKNILIYSKKLNKLLFELKETNNKLYEDWLQLNIDTCNLIINSGDLSKDSTRIFITKALLEEWKNLPKKNNYFTIPNTHYLFDYFKWLKKTVEQYFKDISDNKANQK